MRFGGIPPRAESMVIEKAKGGLTGRRLERDRKNPEILDRWR